MEGIPVPGAVLKTKKTSYVFDFHQEIMEFCRRDVDVPGRFCLKLKIKMEEACNLDLCKDCETTASALRENFLEEDTISIIPSERYQPPLKYSVLALHCLGFAMICNETGHGIFYTLEGGALHIYGCSCYVVGYDLHYRISYGFTECLWLGHAKYFLLDTLNPLNEAS